MRRIVYDVAVSLDGYIAGENDDISAFPGEGDHVSAYLARLETYQTVIMGRRTYEFGYRFGLVPGARAYPHMDHHVFSRSLSVPGDAVTVVQEDWLGALQALRGGDGGDIYLCGGGTFAGFVAGHGFLDLLRVKLAPVALGRGIPIFSSLPRALRMRLIDTKTHGSGVLLMEYAVSAEQR
jgi:dihydrofolate reductase